MTKSEQDKIFKIGYQYLQDKKWDQAINEFKKLIVLESFNTEALLTLGYCYENKSDYKTALLYYDKFLAIQNNDAIAWNNKASCFFNLKKYKEMDESFNQAIKSDPNDGYVFKNRGARKFLMGNFNAAIKDFKKAKEFRVDTQKEINITNNCLRQLEGINLPPEGWKPDLKAYRTIAELVDKKAQLSLVGGKKGVYLSFKGSEDSPFTFAQGYYVWNGGIMDDFNYGTLLQNGTNVKYEKITNEGKIIKTGKIEKWKAKFYSEINTPF